MSEQANNYKIFLKEIERTMHEQDVKDNHALSEAVERKAFDLNIHPRLAVALVNFFWSGFQYGLGKAYNIMKKQKEENSNE